MDVGNLGALGASRNAALLRLLGPDDGNTDDIIRALTFQPRMEAAMAVENLALEMMQAPGLPISVATATDLNAYSGVPPSGELAAVAAQNDLATRVANVYQRYGGL
ncbi:MAG: hypothetical protein U0V73_12085 [Acidimicrobiia bacterium]